MIGVWILWHGRLWQPYLAIPMASPMWLMAAMLDMSADLPKAVSLEKVSRLAQDDCPDHKNNVFLTAVLYALPLYLFGTVWWFRFFIQP